MIVMQQNGFFFLNSIQFNGKFIFNASFSKIVSGFGDVVNIGSGIEWNKCSFIIIGGHTLKLECDRIGLRKMTLQIYISLYLYF